jgi:hypothetical protein
VRQDDLVHFEIRDLGDGKYQAIAVHDLPTRTPVSLRGKDDEKDTRVTQVEQPSATTTTASVIQVSIADGVRDSSNDRLYHFDVTLDQVSTQTVTVRFSTENGVAPNAYTAPTDYTAVVNLLVTFNPGTTLQTVDVTLVRSNCSAPAIPRHFFGTLASPTNAVIVDDRGLANVPVGPC